MKRLFSGSSGSSLFRKESSSSTQGTPKPRSTSFAKRFVSEDSTPNIPDNMPTEDSELSPELVPIVTLLSAQSHRRYHRGIILLLHDLKSDGTPTGKSWEEVYAVLVGTQLAVWDAQELSDCKSDTKEIHNRLKRLAAKPEYLNFNDSTINAMSQDSGFSTDNGTTLENSLIISTTLKNRYFVKFSDKESFNEWNAAIRLSQYEAMALQLAYTGAFLSSRGRKLGDIQVILADNKFSHSEWVSVRFGVGMPWKRCFAVISQAGNKKKKNTTGSISFYENDKKLKKSNVMATVTQATAVYSVYPSSPKLIDTSTIVKVQGLITLNGEENEEQTNIFIMPEKHQGVPGYDTIIRFLIPAMNAFQLYGRPKRLVAGRDDTESLLFALPTLPHIYYLQVDELLSLIKSVDSSTLASWSDIEWRQQINNTLVSLLGNGYTGVGSERRDNSIINSSTITPEELFRGTNTMNSSPFSSAPGLNSASNSDSKYGSTTSFADKPYPNKSDNFLNSSNERLKNPYSDKDHILNVASSSTPDVEANQFSTSNDPLFQQKAATPDSDDRSGVRKSEAGLGAIYDKYAILPFGTSQADTSREQSAESDIKLPNSTSQQTDSPYEKYLGSDLEDKRFEISNIRDSSSSMNSNTDENTYESVNSLNHEKYTPSDEYNELSQKISAIGLESLHTERTKTKGSIDNFADVATDLNLDNSQVSNASQNQDINKYSNSYGSYSNYNEEPNQDVDVFDPDYAEQKDIYSTNDTYNNTSSTSLNKNTVPIDENIGTNFPHSSGTTNLNPYKNHPQNPMGMANNQNNMGNQNSYINPSMNKFEQTRGQGMQKNMYRPNNMPNNQFQNTAQPRNVQHPFNQPHNIRTGPLQSHSNQPNMGMSGGAPLSPVHGNQYQKGTNQYPQQFNGNSGPQYNRHIQNPHPGQMNANGQPQQMPQRYNMQPPNGRNPMYNNLQNSNSSNSLNNRNNAPLGRAGGFSQFMPSTAKKNPYAQ